MLESVHAYFMCGEQHILLARRTFWFGCAGLPFLWLLNWANLRELAADPSASRELQFLHHSSLGGAIISGVLLAAWLYRFQTAQDSLFCACDGDASMCNFALGSDSPTTCTS